MFSAIINDEDCISLLTKRQKLSLFLTRRTYFLVSLY